MVKGDQLGLRLTSTCACQWHWNNQGNKRVRIKPSWTSNQRVHRRPELRGSSVRHSGTRGATCSCPQMLLCTWGVEVRLCCCPLSLRPGHLREDPEETKRKSV